MKTRPAGQTWMALVAKVAMRIFVALGVALLPLMVALPATAQSYSILHTFGGVAEADGWSPVGGLIADSSGNLYGTTQYGGALYGGIFGYGIVYEVPAAGGEKVLTTSLGRPMEDTQLEH